MRPVPREEKEHLAYCLQVQNPGSAPSGAEVLHHPGSLASSVGAPQLASVNLIRLLDLEVPDLPDLLDHVRRPVIEFHEKVGPFSIATEQCVRRLRISRRKSDEEHSFADD